MRDKHAQGHFDDAMALLTEIASEIVEPRNGLAFDVLRQRAPDLKWFVDARHVAFADVAPRLENAMRKRGHPEPVAAVRAAFGLAPIPKAIWEKPAVPRGFQYDSDGNLDVLTDKAWHHLCSPIEVVAHSRDEDQVRWGILVRVKTTEMRWNDILLSRGSLVFEADVALGALADAGLIFNPAGPARAALKRFLTESYPTKFARIVPRIGWSGDSAFVLPDGVSWGGAGDEIYLLQPAPLSHAFRRAGDLAGWQDAVARPSAGNSRLMFSIALALSGPLLRLADLPGGGFHLRGPSSIGKSTALHCAGSVWGGGGLGGFCRSWRSTDNALEATAAGHSDVLLVLDELAEIDAKPAFAAAYMLSNGAGKMRAQRSLAARAQTEWRIQLLSSGEIDLAAKLAEAGQAATAGMGVRFVDLNADAGRGFGLFDKLNGHASAGDLANALRRAAQAHYGHAGPEFVRLLIEDVADSQDWINGIMDGWTKKYCPADAEGQVERVARRFALVSAAAEMAIELGILPWDTNEFRQHSGHLFHEWMVGRGGARNSEVDKGVDQIREAIVKHGSSRFQLIGSPGQVVRDRIGFYELEPDGEGNPKLGTYSFLPNDFKKLTAPCDHLAVARALAKMGAIKQEGKNLANKVALPGLGRTRCYAIKARFLFADGDATSG